MLDEDNHTQIEFYKKVLKDLKETNKEIKEYIGLIGLITVALATNAYLLGIVR